MTTINLTVSGAHAEALLDGPLTSGMVGLPVFISYDRHWDGLTKTLVCRNSMGHTSFDTAYIQANIGSESIVPPEVMMANRTLYLGVEGRNAEGTLVIPTIWADCGMIQPGAEGNGELSQEPTPEVWVQLASQIGPLDELNTASKGNLVSAINDLAAAGTASQENLSQRIALAEAMGSQNSSDLSTEKQALIMEIQTLRDQFYAGINALDGQITRDKAALSAADEALAAQCQAASNRLQAQIDTLSGPDTAYKEELMAAINALEAQHNQDKAASAADHIALIAEYQTIGNQLRSQIGTLDYLETSSKENLVTAINSLARKQEQAPVPEAQPEPGDGDIPRVFLEGTLPEGQEESEAVLTYHSKTDSFSAYLKLHCADFNPKKSFAITMFSDESRTIPLNKIFRDWGRACHSYVLRSNFADHSHARNIVSARLWNDVVASRSDYANLPIQLRESPRNGAIDGFPVKVYVNGTYQGVYTWNLDAAAWNMDNTNSNQGLLRALTNSSFDQNNTPCNFRETWSGVDGDHWALDAGTNSVTLASNLNNLISCVQTTQGDAFRAAIGNHLDVQSALDYYIFQYVICGLDGLGKNLHLATYDGTHWLCGCGDMEATFLLDPEIGAFVASDCACPQDYRETRSLLWKQMVNCFTQEIKERYRDLRAGVLSFPHMCSRFETFMDSIGSELYWEDVEIFNAIPLSEANHMKQIREAIRDRLSYCDEAFENLEPEADGAEIDYTLNPLANVTWQDNVYYVNGELTSKNGEHCTSRFTLQKCMYKLSFVGGMYPSLYMWDKEGNFIGQVENQLSYVVGCPDYQYAFRVYRSSSFDTSTVTITPVNNEETATAPITLKLANLNFTADSSSILVPLDGLFDLETISSATIAPKIHSSNLMLAIGNSSPKTTGIDPETLFVGGLFPSNGTVAFGTRLFGNDLESAMAYFIAHDTTLILNG